MRDIMQSEELRKWGGINHLPFGSCDESQGLAGQEKVANIDTFGGHQSPPFPCAQRAVGHVREGLDS